MKRKKSLSCVNVLHKTWNFHIVVIQWQQKSENENEKMKLLLLAILIAVIIVVAEIKALYCLTNGWLLFAAL